jgi:hypothetical protein
MLRRFFQRDTGALAAVPPPLDLPAKMGVAAGRLAPGTSNLPTWYRELVASWVDLEREAGLAPASPGPLEDLDAYGHAWLGLLSLQHRMAPSLQFSEADLRTPQRLLRAFFLGDGPVDEAIAAMLKLAEQRFTDGRFAQARILLDVFDTEPATRRNNDRTLFYEEHVSALLSQRVQGLARHENLKGPATLASWIAQDLPRARITLHALQTVDWTPATHHLPQPLQADAEGLLAQQLVAAAWRPVGDGTTREELAARLADHATHATLEDWVERWMRASYFIALATGRTGYEQVLLSWLRAMGRLFHVPSMTILPAVHRIATHPQHSVSDGVQIQLERLFSALAPDAALPAHADIEATLDTLARQLFDPQASGVPGGAYDAGALALDHLYGMDDIPLALRMRVHRLH